MNNEAWEEEQMSNLGCESVSDLIVEVKRLHASIEEMIVYLNQELDDWGKAPPAKVMLVGIKACLQEMIE